MRYTFNGHDLEDYVVVEEVRRQLMAPVRTQTYTIPGRDGSRHIRTTLGSRQIEMDVRLIEDTRGDVLSTARTLAGVLMAREPAKLELDESGMYEMAVLDGTFDLEQFLYTGRATLVFLAPDPASYGTEQTVTINEDPITNTGTYPAEGVITVTLDAPASELEVRNVTTGERVYVEHEFVATDVVVFDLFPERVTKNGIPIDDDVSLDSNFFEIPVGTFKLTVSDGAGVLVYTDRWV